MVATEAEPLRAHAPPWWTHPVVGLCIFALPGVGVALMLPDATFVELWGESKHVRAFHAAVAVGSVLSFACGAAWVSLVMGRRRSEPRSVRTPRILSAYRLMVVLTLLGYAAWLMIGVLRGVRPADLTAVIEGRPLASYDLKMLMEPVAGVTTLTQLAPIAGALAGILAVRGEAGAIRRSAAVLLVLAALRAYFLSERLAILEFVLPALVAFLVAMRRTGTGRSTRFLRSWFPVVYVLGAAAMFLAFEFNRSWAYYRLTNPDGYLDFAVERFVGYYTTSMNNASLLYDGLLGARPELFTLQWLVQFPLVGSLIGLGEGRLPLNELLIGHANPDFNTEGALLAPAIDFGLMPSLVVWFGLGIASMAVFRRVRSGELAWLPLYACLYVGILESGRYFYWGLGRAFVPIVAGLLVARYLSTDRIAGAAGDAGDAAAPAPGEVSVR